MKTNTNNKRQGRFMKKGVIALLLATIAGALTFGAAASLSVEANDLGAGTAVVAACDADGITIEWTQLSTFMQTLDLVDVDNRCDGQELAFTVDGALGPTTTFMTIPVDASTTVTVTFAPGVVAEAITSATVIISGEAN